MPRTPPATPNASAGADDTPPEVTAAIERERFFRAAAQHQLQLLMEAYIAFDAAYDRGDKAEAGRLANLHGTRYARLVEIVAKGLEASSEPF